MIRYRLAIWLKVNIMNFKFKKGFTLVEVLAIMVIAAVILAAATPMITKKHRVKPEQVTHGRFECWWEGNQLKQRMISGDKVVEVKDMTSVGSCKFNPPANADKFLVQGVGGGGAGGGAGGSFINSKYEVAEGPTRNSFFQPVVVNGEPETGKYNQGWGNPDTMTQGDPWPTWPNWPLVKVSGTGGQAGVDAKPGGFVADGALKKLGYSTKQVGGQWFKWNHLTYGPSSNNTTNNQAYQYVGVACSGKGGSSGSSTIKDALPYYCLENQKRDTITEKFVKCSGRCSLHNAGDCNTGVNQQGCSCGTWKRWNPAVTNCTTSSTRVCDPVCTNVTKTDCTTTPGYYDYPSCGCRTEHWKRSGCNKSGPWYDCPDSCADSADIVVDCGSRPNPNCTSHVGSSPGIGSMYLFANKRNGEISTKTCGGTSGRPGICTSMKSSITKGISSNVNEQGADGSYSAPCNIDPSMRRCPAVAATDGQDASVTIKGGDYQTSKTCTAYGGGGGSNRNIPGMPNLDASLKSFSNSLGSDSRVASAKSDTNNPETAKKVEYYDNKGNLLKTGVIMDGSVANLIMDWAAAELRAKYMCTCPGLKDMKNAHADCNCVTAHGVKYCGPGGGEYNYRYSWARTYYNQWLAYGEAGRPGQAPEPKYVSRIKEELVILPGRGGVAGDWSSIATSANSADGKDGNKTVVKMGNKTIFEADGGKGGKGANVTDEYTLCSNFMFNTQPSLCAKLNATGTPQRTIFPEESSRNTTGLANFHAAFNIKTPGLTIGSAGSFGIGGEGQGSKSLCDSANDIRRVWAVAPATVVGHHIYDNRTNNGSITKSTDYQQKCATNNVYYSNRNNATGKTHNKVDYATNLNVTPEAWAPEFGGHGAVIITW